jgi:hypothetical protein
MIIQDPGNFTGFESQSQQEFYYSLLASLGFPSKISTVSPLVGMGSFSVASGSSSFFDIGNAGFGAIPSGSLGSYVQNNLFVGSLSLSLITIGWTSAGNSVAQLAVGPVSAPTYHKFWEKNLASPELTITSQNGNFYQWPCVAANFIYMLVAGTGITLVCNYQFAGVRVAF